MEVEMPCADVLGLVTADLAAPPLRRQQFSRCFFGFRRDTPGPEPPYRRTVE
jgi:hypothetical protein